MNERMSIADRVTWLFLAVAAAYFVLHVLAARVASDEELRDLERIQPNLALAVNMYRRNDFTGIGGEFQEDGSCSGG